MLFARSLHQRTQRKVQCCQHTAEKSLLLFNCIFPSADLLLLAYFCFYLLIVCLLRAAPQLQLHLVLVAPFCQDICAMLQPRSDLCLLMYDAGNQRTCRHRGPLQKHWGCHCRLSEGVLHCILLSWSASLLLDHHTLLQSAM